MNREDIRVLKSSLVKEKRNFKGLICRYAYSSSLEDVSKIIQSICSDAKILKKIYNYWLPQNIESLCSYDYEYKSNAMDSTLLWSVFMINTFKEKLMLYIEKKQKYERFLFSQEYEKAYETLRDIEKEICVSLWSIQQTLLVEEYIGGLQQNEKKLMEFAPFISKNYKLQTIINFYSKQAEHGISYENYQERVKNYVSIFANDDITYKYLNYKVNLDYEIDINSMSVPIQIDSQISIIDLYETTVDCFQQIHASDDNKINLYEIVNKIEINTDHRINNIKYNYNVENDLISSSQAEFYKILELYTIGNYEESRKLLKKYIKDYAEDFHAYILLTKCNIKLHKSLKTEIPLLNDFYNIYMLNNKYDEAYLDISLHYKLLNGTSWKFKLKGMLDRKRNTIDSKKYKILTYLNDIYITPSYAFNICNKELCIKWLKKMYVYCPVACDLFLHIYEGVCIEQRIQDSFRKEFYKASGYIEKGNYQKAIEKLEYLLSIQLEDDFYYIEKTSRKLFSAYVYVKDYRKIMDLSCNLFFKNKNLIKKMDFNKIKKELFETSSIDLKADIRFPILIYIIDKNNINQQRIAYSNYMDYNKLYTIEDVIKKEQNNVKLLAFLLYYICNIEILKKDIRVIRSKENAEDIRLFILRKLIKLNKKKTKIYYNEITEISTKKNIRNNMKRINHSRIFVDTVNIKKVNSKVFNEEFDKYLAIKDFTNDIVKLDIANNKLTKDVKTLVAEVKDKRDNNVNYNQEYFVIKSLCERIIEQILYNTQYGLNTFLSSRIRHGFCKSKIKDSFEECNLLSQKEYEVDTIYSINRYWQETFIDEPLLFDDICLILSEFTDTIENKINEVKNSWIKIKYKDVNEGLFDYSTFLTTFLLCFQSERINDFDSFYKLLECHFEVITNDILKSLRDKINTELCNYFIEQLKKLEKKIVKLNNPQYSVIINSINKCKSEVSKSMSEFSEIFYLEKNAYEDFTCSDAIDTCIEINKNINRAFEMAKIEKNVNDNFIIKGDYFPFFVDMIHQVMSNAIEHSKLAMKNLKIKITTEEGISNDILDKIENFELNNAASYLNISISNNVSTSICLENVKKKLDEIFTKFNNIEVIQKYSQTEGGSGLYKLYTTLQYHIGEKCFMYHDVDHENFKLGILIEVDNLFVKGEEHESFAC